MLLTVLAGFSSSPAAATDMTAPVSLPKLSFSVTTIQFGNEPTGKPCQDLWLKKCSELMGRELDIKFQYINVADYAEKLKVLMVSNSLPDIITNWGLRPEELVNYGDKGVFVDLAAHLDEMPNYKKLLDEAPSTVSTISSADGKIYGVYPASVNCLDVDGGHSIWHYMGINKAIFDKNGIPIPTTIDELTDAARKLKAAYPDKYPIFQMEEYQHPLNALMSMNRVGNGFASGDTGRYFDGDKYQYAPLQEGFKDAVATMALEFQLYDKHQHTDELLAHFSLQPWRTPRAACKTG